MPPLAAPKRQRQETKRNLNMKEDYPYKWEPWHGVRELIQNWRDGLITEDMSLDDLKIRETKDQGKVTFSAWPKSLRFSDRTPANAIGLIVFNPQSVNNSKLGILTLVNHGKGHQRKKNMT